MTVCKRTSNHDNKYKQRLMTITSTSNQFSVLASNGEGPLAHGEPVLHGKLVKMAAVGSSQPRPHAIRADAGPNQPRRRWRNGAIVKKKERCGHDPPSPSSPPSSSSSSSSSSGVPDEICDASAKRLKKIFSLDARKCSPDISSEELEAILPRILESLPEKYSSPYFLGSRFCKITSWNGRGVFGKGWTTRAERSTSMAKMKRALAIMRSNDVALSQEAHVGEVVAETYVRRMPNHILRWSTCEPAKGHPSGGVMTVLDKRYTSQFEYMINEVAVRERLMRTWRIGPKGILAVTNAHLAAKPDTAAWRSFIQKCGAKKLSMDYADVLMGDFNFPPRSEFSIHDEEFNDKVNINAKRNDCLEGATDGFFEVPMQGPTHGTKKHGVVSEWSQLDRAFLKVHP